MGDKRETRGTNWRVREPIGVRAPPPRPDYGRNVLERVEQKLKEFEGQREQDEPAN